MARMSFILTDKQAEELKKIARERELNVSDVMRRILDGVLPFRVTYEKGGIKDDATERNDQSAKPVAIVR